MSSTYYDYSPRPLFGGAMVCDIPTTGWRDVSTVRPVPDHQEVWQSHDQELLVVEILERQPVDDSHAAAFFFADLVIDEEESHAEDELGNLYFQPSAVPLMTNVEGAIVCAGSGFQKTAAQSHANGNERDATENHEIGWATIELCVLRLPRVQTDLLVTITRPLTNPNEEPRAFANGSRPWSAEFQRILSSMQVRDWGLFGSSDAEALDANL
jgi:Ran-interacting Mog1 protein